MTSTTALIGAFERDNFGDVLFLELTQDALATGITPVAPFGAPPLYRAAGSRVFQYAETLATQDVTGVWVVGGEVGGTSLTDAYVMASTDAQADHFEGLSSSAKRALICARSEMSSFSSPYIPRMSASRRSFHSRLIVNSVGLSGIAGLRGLRADEAWGAIREANFISVRDKASSAVLHRAGIPHRLAPDLVHTLRLRHPEWLTAQNEPYALVHAKASVVRKYGADLFASLLAEADALSPYEIRLFLAGSARGHDSVELYEQIIRAFKHNAPSRKITMSMPSSALSKAEEIARAALWIGTSLHGLIISSSFDVPRIGLELDKLVRYARTWDDPMPVGTALTDLSTAVEEALSIAGPTDRSTGLAELAQSNFDHARDAMFDPATDLRGIVAKRSRTATLLNRRRGSFARTAYTLGFDATRRWLRK